MTKRKETLLERLKEKTIIKKILRKDLEYIKDSKNKTLNDISTAVHEDFKIEHVSSLPEENKDLHEEIIKAIGVNNKSIIRREDNTPDNIWFALINPERATEVRAWLLNNQMKALILRGPQKETMLHWAVLSEYSLVIDLVDTGIDINCKDKNGLTPMDWLIERFWELSTIKKDSIPYHGRLKLAAQTEELGLLAYSMGGRPTDFNDLGKGSNNSAAKMTMCGAFWYIEALYKDKGLDFLKNWLDNKRSVIHVWLLSLDNGMKYKRLQKMLDWGLSIDEKDKDGRTPLWYVVEAWSLGNDRARFEKIIKHLLKMGADPDEEDNEGVSPRLIMNLETNTSDEIKYLENFIRLNSKK